MDKLDNFQEAWKQFDEHHGDGSRTLIERIVGGVYFKALCMMAIAGNTIYLGLAADHTVKKSYRGMKGYGKEEEWIVPDIVFASWFAVEIALRIWKDKKIFFTGPDWKWNLFDLVLVLESIFDVLVKCGTNLSFLRILRVIRLVRVVRVVRTVKALRRLRTMIFSILNSFSDLLWAFVVVLLIVFVFGIIFVNGAAAFFENIPKGAHAEAESLNKHFGGLWEAMISLWCAISGGNDWWEYAELLRLFQYGEVYLLLFFFYVAFCMIGLLNVVTGIFVDSAVCTRTEDEVVESYKEDLKRTSEEMKRIFHEADEDGNGKLSFSELQARLEDPWVKAYFAGLDIDPSEVRTLFTLIDVDCSDELSIEEFINGTMKLKGYAKNIDVVSMMYDSSRFALKFDRLCKLLEERLTDPRTIDRLDTVKE